MIILLILNFINVPTTKFLEKEDILLKLNTKLYICIIFKRFIDICA